MNKTTGQTSGGPDSKKAAAAKSEETMVKAQKKEKTLFGKIFKKK